MRSSFSKLLISKFPGAIDFIMIALFLSFGGAMYLLHRRASDKLSYKALAFQRDSLEAVADSTRRINGVLASNLNLVTRRAVQAEIRSDSLDKKLKVATKQIDNLTFQIATLTAHTTSVVRSDTTDSVRTADFHIRKEPHTIDAVVSLPKAPAQGTMDITVKTDAARVQVRAVCGKATNGIKSASILVRSPSWLDVTVDSVVQDPDVCNPPEQKSSAWQKVKGVGWFVLGALVGRAF